jgi:hypothetical protein
LRKPVQIKYDPETLPANIRASCLIWRSYIAKRFDRKEETILSGASLTSLVNRLELNPGIGEEELTRNLEDLRVNDNFKKAARLLLIYLNQNKEQLA